MVSEERFGNQEESCISVGYSCLCKQRLHATLLLINKKKEQKYPHSTCGFLELVLSLSNRKTIPTRYLIKQAMINDALDFLVEQLNEFLRLKVSSVGDIVVMQRLTTATGNEQNLNNKVVFQLINIEEERIGKAQLPVTNPIGSSYPRRNPEIKLNLSVLFTACGDTDGVDNGNDYSTSVMLLSYVIQYFQYKHVFTKENSPGLPAGIDELILELYPVSLENQNYLWASLGAKYRPSVVYKVRLISVFEEGFTDLVSMPRELTINTNQ